MKAKEYAKIINDAPVEKKAIEALKALKEIITDTADVMKARNVQSNAGLLSVIKEARLKWKAVVKRVVPFEVEEGTASLKESAFDAYMKKYLPDLYIQIMALEGYDQERRKKKRSRRRV